MAMKNVRVPSDRRTRRGQTLVEYALIIAVVAVVVVGVMLSMGHQVKGFYSTMTSDMASAQASH